VSNSVLLVEVELVFKNLRYVMSDGEFNIH